MDVSIDYWLQLFPGSDRCLATDFATGYFHSEFLLPTTLLGEHCLPLHGIFSPKKYREVRAPASSAEGESTYSVMEDGIIFLGQSNYWHFLVDGMATLRGPFGGAQSVYFRKDVPRPWCSFVLEFLAFEHPNARFVARTIPDGISLLRGVRSPWVGALGGRLSALRNRLASLRTFSGAEVTQTEFIWVSRSAAGYRRLLNEDELISITRRYLGEVIVVDPGRLSLREQISLFGSCRYIAGAHGAGLCNAIFASAPRGILELWHSMEQPFFRALSVAVGCDYEAIKGNSVHNGSVAQRPDNQDFEICPAIFEKRLRAMLHRIHR
jgi:hypothetical protein